MGRQQQRAVAAAAEGAVDQQTIATLLQQGSQLGEAGQHLIRQHGLMGETNRFHRTVLARGRADRGAPAEPA